MKSEPFGPSYIYEKFNAIVRLVAHHPQLCLNITTGDFLTGTGDLNKRFILHFYVFKGTFDKHELAIIAKGRPSFL